MDTNTSELLFQEASRRGLNPKWETDYGLFSFEGSSKKQYLFFSKLPFNSQLSAEFAKNKHFTHLILDQAKISTVPYYLPQHMSKAKEFLKRNQIVIAKPMIGERSHQVSLISDEVKLSQINLASMMLEKYIEGNEVRYLVLKGKVIGVIHKHLHPLPKRPWHKLNETIPESKWDKKLIQVAMKVANTLELQWCAIDFIIDKKGKAWVLEVNSAPGIKFFHYPDKGEPINVAKTIFEELVFASIRISQNVGLR